jgi:hypothetical protein
LHIFSQFVDKNRFLFGYVMETADAIVPTNGQLCADDVDVEILPIIYEILRG